MIYCHPEGEINNFLKALNKKSDLLSNIQYCLLGNFNIKVTSGVNNEGSFNYLRTISSNRAYFLIDKPIRVTNVS